MKREGEKRERRDVERVERWRERERGKGRYKKRERRDEERVER